MTALYLLAQEYRVQAAALADLDMPAEAVADTLESIGGEVEAKAQAVAMMARSLDADAAACEQWARQSGDLSKAYSARANALREYLAQTMTACGIQRISGPGVTLSFRASHAVVIEEAALIPAQYMTTPKPAEPAPDKAAIKAAIKLGEDVPGARIETRQNLQVK